MIATFGQISYTNTKILRRFESFSPDSKKISLLSNSRILESQESKNLLILRSRLSNSQTLTSQKGSNPLAQVPKESTEIP